VASRVAKEFIPPKEKVVLFWVGRVPERRKILKDGKDTV
jgi:hypothetical protein